MYVPIWSVCLSVCPTVFSVLSCLPVCILRLPAYVYLFAPVFLSFYVRLLRNLNACVSLGGEGLLSGTSACVSDAAGGPDELQLLSLSSLGRSGHLPQPPL